MTELWNTKGEAGRHRNQTHAAYQRGRSSGSRVLVVHMCVVGVAMDGSDRGYCRHPASPAVQLASRRRQSTRRRERQG
ncbi:hypothetical protein O3P69_001972 [Scylla paramamosain]|uniref:Uncharacterized protein n=1 Tax=Scylla paramamosain TaxID=85552 RepID=A0AAW0V1K4_SCYPA